MCKVNQPHIFRPTIFDMKNREARAKLRVLLHACPNLSIFDDRAREEAELALVRRPALILQPDKEKRKKTPRKMRADYGVAVYYPWRATIVRIMSRAVYAQLRTSRNQDLITKNEQRQFAGFRIGIAGLNVGNPAALCIALEGGGAQMKFADNDILTASNLNRFRAGVCDLGLNKAALSARQVYEINPFARIAVFEDGISEKNMDWFLLKPRLDLLIEEMDNLKLKITIRELARAHRIPVLMVTGNGEDVIVDIERFDTTPDLPLLNGYLKKHVIDAIERTDEHTTAEETIFLARDFMGAHMLTKRLRQSFLRVGSALAGIPQIAESSFLRGAVLCYVARQIATRKSMPSGRYHFRLSTLIKN